MSYLLKSLLTIGKRSDNTKETSEDFG